MNFELLEQILESGTREELDRFIEENQLEIVDGKIKHKNPSYVKQQYEFCISRVDCLCISRITPWQIVPDRLLLLTSISSD